MFYLFANGQTPFEQSLEITLTKDLQIVKVALDVRRGYS